MYVNDADIFEKSRITVFMLYTAGKFVNYLEVTVQFCLLNGRLTLEIDCGRVTVRKLDLLQTRTAPGFGFMSHDVNTL
jgi:hypothetical protein